MARFFDVQIISGTAPGPYTIYYDTISVSNIVTLTNSGNPATNISFSSLSLGVNVTIPDNTTSIILFNEQCSIDETFIVPTSTPTPTPTSTPTPTPTATNTPTPTPTATNTPTPTPTATNTPTPTPTPNCEFDFDLSVNYTPTDISLTNNSINENNSINTTIGSLSTVTLDTSDTHTYSIVGGSSNFNISGNDLRASVVFNYESTTSYNITIRTTDSVGQFYDKLFTIFVNNVNEAPYGLTINNNSQQENTSIGTDIGTFSTLDEDVGDTFTYSLHDTSNFPDNNSFTLTSSGVLRNAVVFNFEVKTSYTIRVRTTDAGGLTYDGTFTINVTNQNEPPTNINLSSSSISENVPTGTTIGTLSATDVDSGDTFTFSLVDVGLYPDNNSFFIDGTTLKSSVIFDFETKSSYSIRVRVTDAGGLTFDKTITITITNVTIVVTASATTNVTCNGGNNGVITVSNATGGTASYTYSRDGVNYQVGTTFSSLTAGLYTIYAKDSYGEIGTTSVTVTQPAAITFSTTNNSPTCNGGTDGSIVVSGVSGGNGTYTYSKDGTNYQAGTTFSSLSSGSYTIYVRDSNNCIGTTSVTLSRTAVTATVTQTNLTCFNGGNGSISITNVSGGQGDPYSTKLNVGGTYQVLSTTRNYTSLSAGSYTVFVKDTAGCEVTYPITLTQPTQVTVTLTSSTPPTCYNGGDGSISFSAGGGNGSYQYRLNGGTWQPSGIFTGLSVGIYTIQTRDTNGCESSTTNVTLTKSAPTASVSQTNVSCNGGSNGTITVSSPSGGSGSGYTYSRDGVNYQSSGTFSSLSAGSYDIYVRDGANCVSYLTTITITQPSTQTSTITVNTFATCNGGADGAITLSSSGGTFPKTYRLYADTSAPYTTCGGDLVGTYSNVSSGSPSVSVSGIDEFGYCLEVTDNNGCVTNSGVVETTSCTGNCYTINIPPSMTTNNGESLYIEYYKTNNVFVSENYNNFIQDLAPNGDILINVCAALGVSFRYGTSGTQFIADGLIGLTLNGKCDNSEWCGGSDPYVPPAPTNPPSSSYSCKSSPGGECSLYNSPCSTLGLLNCDELEEIQ